MRNRVLSFKTAVATPPVPSDRRSAPRSTLQRITVGLSVKAEGIDEKARTFEGLLSVWGPDLGDDVMHRGAFAKTLKEWKKGSDAIPLLNSHNHFDVLSSFGQLIEAKETADGLWTKWEVIPGADGDRILDRIRPGSNGRAPVSKMSIGYEPMKFDFEQSDAARFGRLRNLREVNLKEGSLVLFPMAPGARVDTSTVKSWIDEANELDPADVSPELKTELRRLASRIGLLLSGKAKPTGSTPEPESTDDSADEPGAPGGDNPTEVPATPPAPPPATPPAPPASDPPPAESGEGKGAYLYGEALQQRLRGLRLGTAITSSQTPK